MTRWFWLLVFILAGCGGTPTTQQASEQAVSQQASNSEVRHRAKVHAELGALYLQDGRFGVALEEAKIATTADPSYAPGFNLMALVHMYLQERGPAEENFQKALRLAPNDPEVNNNYGWFLCTTDREKQGIEHFMVAVKNPLYTTPAKPLTNAGLCYLKQKDDRNAEEFLVRSLRLDVNNPQALYALSEIYYRGGRLREARVRLGDLHKITEPNAQSTWLALLVERRLGDREAEARHAVQLRRRFQGSPEYDKLMQGRYE
ncbi:MAG: type IV pilus biogenesis/stability protein PilW [Sterolibacteriaceae bacterium MAG5]|nr:type IV pilus biogenesis/stability protein PilW [Candidatus Nitricoxidireducens bremensis]